MTAITDSNRDLADFTSRVRHVHPKLQPWAEIAARYLAEEDPHYGPHDSLEAAEELEAEEFWAEAHEIVPPAPVLFEVTSLPKAVRVTFDNGVTFDMGKREAALLARTLGGIHAGGSDRDYLCRRRQLFVGRQRPLDRGRSRSPNGTVTSIVEKRGATATIIRREGKVTLDLAAAAWLSKGLWDASARSKTAREGLP
jgi:hypothetical protein